MIIPSNVSTLFCQIKVVICNTILTFLSFESWYVHKSWLKHCLKSALQILNVLWLPLKDFYWFTISVSTHSLSVCCLSSTVKFKMTNLTLGFCSSSSLWCGDNLLCHFYSPVFIQLYQMYVLWCFFSSCCKGFRLRIPSLAFIQSFVSSFRLCTIWLTSTGG